MFSALNAEAVEMYVKTARDSDQSNEPLSAGGTTFRLKRIARKMGWICPREMSGVP